MDKIVNTEKFDEQTIEFWHSDEVRPFLTVVADTIEISENGSAFIYSRDYSAPIATVIEWDFWRQA